MLSRRRIAKSSKTALQRAVRIQSLETRTLLSFNGALDLTFGKAGIARQDIPALQEGTVSDVALQSDGKIVVPVTVRNGGFAVRRYNANGSLDSTFGKAGTATFSVNAGADAADAVVVQPDGKIVAAGRIGGAFALLRFNSNGTLDSTFNGTGKIQIFGSKNAAEALDLIRQPDGKLVAAGYVNGNMMMIARFTSAGKKDSTFDAVRC
jgi:uncharacterized delta-60 repeat protein